MDECKHEETAQNRLRQLCDKRRETSSGNFNSQLSSRYSSVNSQPFIMSTEDQLPFTFGVEFEFVFGIRRSSVYDVDDRKKHPQGLFQSWIAPVLAKILADQDVNVLMNGVNDTSS